MKTIELNQGQVALVDDEDFDRVNQGPKWSLLRLKHTQTLYAVRNVRVDGKRVKQKLHRFILNLGPDDPDVDHRDGNGLNCTRDNLRPATNQQNGCNRRKQRQEASSQFKGVSWHKSTRKWDARIQVNGKNKCLGRFDSELTAARAYNLAAIQLHGEFAHLNEIRAVA